MSGDHERGELGEALVDVLGDAVVFGTGFLRIRFRPTERHSPSSAIGDWTVDRVSPTDITVRESDEWRPSWDAENRADENRVLGWVDMPADWGSGLPNGCCNAGVRNATSIGRPVVVCGYPRRSDGTCTNGHPAEPADVKRETAEQIRERVWPS